MIRHATGQRKKDAGGGGGLEKRVRSQRIRNRRSFVLFIVNNFLFLKTAEGERGRKSGEKKKEKTFSS